MSWTFRIKFFQACRIAEEHDIALSKGLYTSFQAVHQNGSYCNCIGFRERIVLIKHTAFKTSLLQRSPLNMADVRNREMWYSCRSISLQRQNAFYEDLPHRLTLKMRINSKQIDGLLDYLSGPRTSGGGGPDQAEIEVNSLADTDDLSISQLWLLCSSLFVMARGQWSWTREVGYDTKQRVAKIWVTVISNCCKVMRDMSQYSREDFEIALR